MRQPHRIRIMVIDDEILVSKLLQAFLETLGYEAKVADNGSEALVKLKQRSYDLIMMDIRMPGLSGIGLFENIKQELPELSKKVLFITGDVIQPDTWSFLRETRQPFLTKPFELGRLKEKVAEALAASSG